MSSKSKRRRLQKLLLQPEIMVDGNEDLCDLFFELEEFKSDQDQQAILREIKENYTRGPFRINDKKLIVENKGETFFLKEIK